MAKISAFLIAALTLPAASWAADLSPWYTKAFEIHPEVTATMDHSGGISGCKSSRHKNVHAGFLLASAKASAFDWSGEMEVLLAGGSFRSFGLDSAALTARYQLTDDVSGQSPFSSVASLSVCSATRNAVNDLCSFHHGKLEAAFHLSIGKEFSCGQFWLLRSWGALGLGVADVGSPWAHLRLCTETNNPDQSRWNLFLDGLYGFGTKDLASRHSFHGYGPIAHRSLDLGASYSYTFENNLETTISYSYRLYARNFPKNTNRLSLTLSYPFGL